MKIQHSPNIYYVEIEENTSFATEVENDEELASFLSEMTTEEE